MVSSGARIYKLFADILQIYEVNREKQLLNINIMFRRRCEVSHCMYTTSCTIYNFSCSILPHFLSLY